MRCIGVPGYECLSIVLRYSQLLKIFKYYLFPIIYAFLNHWLGIIIIVLVTLFSISQSSFYIFTSDLFIAILQFSVLCSHESNLLLNISKNLSVIIKFLFIYFWNIDLFNSSLNLVIFILTCSLLMFWTFSFCKLTYAY
jgi:hypothetical protein